MANVKCWPSFTVSYNLERWRFLIELAKQRIAQDTTHGLPTLLRQRTGQPIRLGLQINGCSHHLIIASR
jgi:hypothetical protein